VFDAAINVHPYWDRSFDQVLAQDARDASSYANIDASGYDVRFVALLSISCSSTFS